MNLVYSAIHKYYPNFSKDEDVIQAGMLGLWKAAMSWNEEKHKFSTYAITCILNEIRMEFRHRCKQPPETLSLDYKVQQKDGDTTTFGDIIAGQEDIEFVDIEGVYKKLTPREQEVFKLKLSGMSNYEISDATGIPYKTVNRLLRKAKRLLKD